MSRYQKRKTKTNLDFLEQETVSSSGISWAICKSAPRPSQITMPAPHHSDFTGRMPFLPPNQQRQSTEEYYMGISEYVRQHAATATLMLHTTIKTNVGSNYIFVDQHQSNSTSN